jgi:hypothetical protein
MDAHSSSMSMSPDRNPLVTSAGRAVSKWTLCGAGPVDAARNIYRDRGGPPTDTQPVVASACSLLPVAPLSSRRSRLQNS